MAKIYPLNPQEVDVCKEFVEESLKTGRIWPLKSHQASPFFFVKKRDGKLQPVQDYRYLNDHTIKNAYPLPLVSNLVNNLQCLSHFTKFDVHWGYNVKDASVKDARPTQTYSFLPASWAGDTHEETDFLPIGD